MDSQLPTAEGGWKADGPLKMEGPVWTLLWRKIYLQLRFQLCGHLWEQVDDPLWGPFEEHLMPLTQLLGPLPDQLWVQLHGEVHGD